MKNARIVLAIGIFFLFGKDAIGILIGRQSCALRAIEFARGMMATTTILAIGNAGKGCISGPGIENERLPLWTWATDIDINVIGIRPGHHWYRQASLGDDNAIIIAAVL